MAKEKPKNTAKGNSRDRLLDVVIGLASAPKKKNNRAWYITLQMCGFLVTGYIVSQEQYFTELLAKDGENNTTGNNEKDLPADAKTENLDVGTEALFIHLKDTRFFTCASYPIPIAGEGFLWRGRVDKIDGYFFGNPAPSRKTNI